MTRLCAHLRVLGSGRVRKIGAAHCAASTVHTYRKHVHGLLRGIKKVRRVRVGMSSTHALTRCFDKVHCLPRFRGGARGTTKLFGTVRIVFGFDIIIGALTACCCSGRGERQAGDWFVLGGGIGGRCTPSGAGFVCAWRPMLCVSGVHF